mgnify:CR=1 FL=1
MGCCGEPHAAKMPLPSTKRYFTSFIIVYYLMFVLYRRSVVFILEPVESNFSVSRLGVITIESNPYTFPVAELHIERSAYFFV